MLSSLKMCTFKRKSKDDKSKKVLPSEQLSLILKFNIPLKFKDPSVPTISCYIGEHRIERAIWILVLVLICYHILFT